MTEAAAGLPDIEVLSVGILGGTGPQGRGLGLRLAIAGQRVVLGSRSTDRAAAAAAELAVPQLTGADNASCASESDVVVVAVPWEGHRELLESLRAELVGKVVVDCVNPIGFDNRGAYPLDVAEGSAAQQAQAVLPESTVVAAFNHMSAVVLLNQDIPEVDLDVMVLGDDRAATDLVQALASRIPGVRGLYGGRLRNARQVEALTANLISINRRYKAHAGVRITDV